MAPRTVIIIPARYASTRFPGKPLYPLQGSNGEERPLLEWTWRLARSIPRVSGLYIATDSDEIAATTEAFGGKVIMTSESCRNGTERCAEALGKLPFEPDLVINLQGDAPLTPPTAISQLIDRATTASNPAVFTPALRCSLNHFERLERDARRGIVGATTVVRARDGRALYFSKQLVPYVPQSQRGANLPIRLHLGVYAYTPASLKEYVSHPEAPVEQLEGLEQLRFLDFGCRVEVISIDPPAWDIWELNNPDDVAIVERGLAQMANP